MLGVVRGNRVWVLRGALARQVHDVPARELPHRPQPSDALLVVGRLRRSEVGGGEVASVALTPDKEEVDEQPRVDEEGLDAGVGDGALRVRRLAPQRTEHLDRVRHVLRLSHGNRQIVPSGSRYTAR